MPKKTQHWGSKGKEFEQLIAGALDFANDLQFEGSGYSEWQHGLCWVGGLGRVGLDFVLQRPRDSLDWCYQNWRMLSKLRISPWFWLEYFQQVHNPAQLDLGLWTTTYSYATVGVELSKLEARDLNILPPNEQWN